MNDLAWKAIRPLLWMMVGIASLGIPLQLFLLIVDRHTLHDFFDLGISVATLLVAIILLRMGIGKGSRLEAPGIKAS